MSATLATPYELLGGEAPLRRLVERFYDVMDAAPEAAQLRRLHAADLGPMRERLFEFLSGWLGGPALYQQRPDARCMSAAHAPYAIDERLGEQWLLCMDRALVDTAAPECVRDMVRPAFARVAAALRNA